MVNTDKELGCRKILRCTNKYQVVNLIRYLDKVKYKWFNNTEEV